MQQYNYSIIIPHKNISDLLQRCLDSIPKREDVQVIIVDDNSDPKEVDFEHFPGLDCPNTEVYFDKTGKGAGYARNIGLQHAKGMWVLFADADDYYNTNELQTQLNTDFSEYDVVAWSCMRITKEESFVFNYFDTSNVNKDSLFKMPEPWRKMVRLSLLNDNNIRFQESTVSNDLYYSMQVAYHCKHFAWTESVMYFWVEREGSLSNKYCGDTLISALDVSIYVNRYLITINKSQYFDKTGYYLRYLWKESPIKYWFYLARISLCLGNKYARKFNREACDYNCLYHNVFFQIAYVMKRKLKSILWFQ